MFCLKMSCCPDQSLIFQVPRMICKRLRRWNNKVMLNFSHRITFVMFKATVFAVSGKKIGDY